ncbi:MAG: hypothetical protein EPN88_02045 [Bacteroidetes bacterium]|nr:MAG: hypothetical protein EPN88_02045 [Bacteroidota bacterium]
MKQVKKGEVYFIQCGSLYKIGATANLYGRFSAIRTTNPDECFLIHSIKSNDMFLTESLFKERFSRINIHGEWFTLSDTDISYIKTGRYSKAIQSSIGNTKQWTVIPELMVV